MKKAKPHDHKHCWQELWKNGVGRFDKDDKGNQYPFNVGIIILQQCSVCGLVRSIYAGRQEAPVITYAKDDGEPA